MSKLGRKAEFENSKTVAKALRAVRDNGLYKSRFLTLKLVERGFVEAVNMPSGFRGRPRVNYVLTGKGRGYVALSKNWG